MALKGPGAGKLLRWGTVALLVFWVAYRPNSAVEVARSIGGGVMAIATGFGDFFKSLVG